MTIPTHETTGSVTDTDGRRQVAGTLWPLASEIERLGDRVNKVAWDDAGSIIVYPTNHQARLDKAVDLLYEAARLVADTATAHEGGTP